MRRLRFNVAYDGTDFHGWQIQPGMVTIQACLEEVIGRLEGARVHVAGSGRTDAGVHAYGQVAAVSLNNPIPTENFRRAVNRLLPESIRISQVAETDTEFHPRFQAKRKTYEYRIFRNEICSPFERRYVHHHPFPLDEDAMRSAALLLVGTHDFGCFAASDDRDIAASSKVRTIFSSELRRDGSLLIYRVQGSGFLKYMVRNLIGVLIEVGRGNVTQNGVLERLTAGCLLRPGPTAPASGLFLMEVFYD